MRLIAHNDSMRREKQGNRTLSESRFPTSHSMFYNVTPFLKMENYSVTPFLKMENYNVTPFLKMEISR